MLPRGRSSSTPQRATNSEAQFSFPVNDYQSACREALGTSPAIHTQNSAEPSSFSSHLNCFSIWKSPANEFCTFECPFLYAERGNASSNRLAALSLYDKVAKKIKIAGSRPPFHDVASSDRMALIVNEDSNQVQFSYPSAIFEVFKIGRENSIQTVLPKAVKSFSHIVVDFGGSSHVCSRAVFDLLRWSRRVVIMGHSAWKSAQKYRPPVRPPFPPSDSLTDWETTFQAYFLSSFHVSNQSLEYLRKERALMENMAKFSFIMASNHYSVAHRCTTLLKSTNNAAKGAGEVNTPANDTSSSTPSSLANSEKFMIVVSRYKEPLQELVRFTKFPNYVINRGDPNDSFAGLNLHHDPVNTGRETAVYLQYIIKHYDRLPRMVVFTQAVPIHGIDHEYDAQKFDRDLQFLYHQATSSDYQQLAGFQFLGRVSCSVGLGLSAFEFNFFFRRFLSLLLNDDNNNDIDDSHHRSHLWNRWFRPGATFVVSREHLLRRSKASYVALLNWLLEPTQDTRAIQSASSNNPTQGHLFERFWPSVFFSDCVTGSFDACWMTQQDGNSAATIEQFRAFYGLPYYVLPA